MKKLLYIDACIRGTDSRTKKIATPIIDALKEKYDVETLVLNDLELEIVKEELIKKRNNGEISDTVLTWAKKVRDAERIVIASPFWDMSFPAALKVFIELCSIFDITFKSNDKTCYGNCKAEKMMFITTRRCVGAGNPLFKSYFISLGNWTVVCSCRTEYGLCIRERDRE